MHRGEVVGALLEAGQREVAEEDGAGKGVEVGGRVGVGGERMKVVGHGQKASTLGMAQSRMDLADGGKEVARSGPMIVGGSGGDSDGGGEGRCGVGRK